MKPLNLDNRPCSPVSSNCIVWQGPDIPCIELCNGDTISDVIFKLATELCTILDQTNVSNYDLSCLGITACGPKDFQALIQLLIEKICELQGLTPDTSKVTGTCPDCIVTVAPCFRTGNVTTMQLLDYVQMIAEKVCALIDQIATINTQITDILIRLEDLENTPIPTSDIPAFALTCPVGSVSGTQYINIILQAFINEVWCDYYDATGTTTELLTAVAAICIQDTDLQLTTGTPFSTNADWIDSGSYGTVADAINNLWVALCDIYSYLGAGSLVVEDTNTIDLTYNTTTNTLSANLVDTGWVDLLGFSTYMNQTAGTQYTVPQVRRMGNVLHFRGTLVVPLAELTGALRPWILTTTENNYEEDTPGGAAATIVTPFTGIGGVVLNSFGSIQFNRGATGSPLSVIPTSVLSGGYSLDGSYSHPTGYKVAHRNVKIAANTSSVLTTLVSVSISSTGILAMNLVKNLEESFVNSSDNAFDTSHLNYIISHVRAGENVPKFSNANTTVNSHAGAGTIPIDLEYTAGATYPFSCNANDEDEIGGFYLNLAGLTAFLDPCTTDIKSYVCP